MFPGIPPREGSIPPGCSHTRRKGRQTGSRTWNTSCLLLGWGRERGSERGEGEGRGEGVRGWRERGGRGWREGGGRGGVSAGSKHTTEGSVEA